MKSDLEAVLFASEAPLAMGRLRALFPDATPQQLRAAVEELRAEYDRDGRAFTVVEFGGGWQIATRPEHAGLVNRLYGGRRHVRLTKAGLEVLAIIAYRQPITRLAIEEVRGVQSSGALATLLERNLITVVGRADTVGHPILYGTTREFLGHLGLKGLGQLPALPEIEQVMGDREEFKRFALQFGQEISDDDLEELDGEGSDGPPGEAGAGPDADDGSGEPGEWRAPGLPDDDAPTAGADAVEPVDDDAWDEDGDDGNAREGLDDAGGEDAFGGERAGA